MDSGAARRLLDYVNRYGEADHGIPREVKVRFVAYDKKINKQ